MVIICHKGGERGGTGQWKGQERLKAHLLNSLSSVFFVLFLWFHPTRKWKRKVQVDYSKIEVNNTSYKLILKLFYLSSVVPRRNTYFCNCCWRCAYSHFICFISLIKHLKKKNYSHPRFSKLQAFVLLLPEFYSLNDYIPSRSEQLSYFGTT